MNLGDVRGKIDTIDLQIVKLLNDRAKLAEDVAKAKGDTPKFAPAREAQVIKNVLRANTGPFKDESLKAIYREIIACLLALEEPLRVSYLGPAGTYSEEAARTRFGVPARLVPCATLDDVVKAAEQNEADVAVVPVENSTEGAVNRTLDLLQETPLTIVGELGLPIHHQLLTKAKNLADVTVVAAHPQSLAQCRAWLQKNLPNAKHAPMESNAEAAQAAAADTHMAAIAGKLAAEEYNLPIVVSNIEDDRQNTTRFLILANMEVPASGSDKTSLVCSVPNKPGSLAKLITVISDSGVNITKLTSRPSPTGMWDYVFYIDVDGHRDDEAVSAALKNLTEQALFIKVLGSYPKDTK